MHLIFVCGSRATRRMLKANFPQTFPGKSSMLPRSYATLFSWSTTNSFHYFKVQRLQTIPNFDGLLCFVVYHSFCKHPYRLYARKKSPIRFNEQLDRVSQGRAIFFLRFPQQLISLWLSDPIAALPSVTPDVCQVQSENMRFAPVVLKPILKLLHYDPHVSPRRTTCH